MNTKNEFEIIDKQLEEIYKYKNLIHAIDLFQKVQLFNVKFGVDKSEVTAFSEGHIFLSAKKDGNEINKYIGLVLKDYDIESVSYSCFIETLPQKRCNIITIKNDMDIDEFMNRYLNSEYNSLYLYKKMLPEFEVSEKNNMKKPKI